jgi:ribosome-binding protein aMBF1 (putative translation factor)
MVRRRRLGWLRANREGKFLSQRELAAKAGVSRSTVVDIEAGRVCPQPRTVRKLAEALGVQARELVREEE